MQNKMIFIILVGLGLFCNEIFASSNNTSCDLASGPWHLVSWGCFGDKNYNSSPTAMASKLLKDTNNSADKRADIDYVQNILSQNKPHHEKHCQTSTYRTACEITIKQLAASQYSIHVKTDFKENILINSDIDITNVISRNESSRLIVQTCWDPGHKNQGINYVHDIRIPQGVIINLNTTSQPITTNVLDKSTQPTQSLTNTPIESDQSTQNPTRLDKSPEKKVYHSIIKYGAVLVGISLVVYNFENIRMQFSQFISALLPRFFAQNNEY